MAGNNCVLTLPSGAEFLAHHVCMYGDSDPANGPILSIDRLIGPAHLVKSFLDLLYKPTTGHRFTLGFSPLLSIDNCALVAVGDSYTAQHMCVVDGLDFHVYAYHHRITVKSNPCS
jgi:hypothetical protein